MSTWGVYKVRGRLPGGKEVDLPNAQAKSYFVRWRVDGHLRRRTFNTKGHAKTFFDELEKARLFRWDADEEGWPIDPARPAPTSIPKVDDTEGEAVEDPRSTGHTFESYVWEVWWPTLTVTLGDKNRLGHRRNAEVAVDLIRYTSDDRRLGPAHLAGASISLHHLVADDLKAAVSARRRVNGRTAATNRRRLETARKAEVGVVDVTLQPEKASPSTVRQFAVTLGMIAKAAKSSGHISGDPMAGVMALAPMPRTTRLGQRLVPTIDEIFDLADAISELGPVMPDGRHVGERFRSLILAAGTLGPRPGELTAHRPEWLTSAGPSLVRFQMTEAAVYDTKEGSPGIRERQLKHRLPDEYRDVPVLPEVAEAIQVHIERGYSNTERTWLSPSGTGHVNWGNLGPRYWRPAMERVFGLSGKSTLASASPKILRKAAITWWLERGVAPAVAAEWAGHTEEVMELYYAGRSSQTWAVEADLLRRSRGT